MIKEYQTGYKLNSVAIVGSDGFIGKKLSFYLESQNYYVKKFNSKNPIFFNSEFKKQIFGVQHIIWCAARVNPITAQLREDLVELELNEWKIFLKSCGSYLQSNQSIIFLSSGGCIYTAGSKFFSEEDEAFGANQYGRLKIAMENELIKSGLPNSILRVANVYGPNQPYGRGQGVIAEWIHSIQNGKEIRVYGELDSFRDYLFIEDLCFAIQLVIENVSLENIFNVGTGVATTLQDILDVLVNLGGDKMEIIRMKGRQIDRSGYYLNISRIKNVFGWIPKYSLNSGILKTLNFNGNNSKK